MHVTAFAGKHVVCTYMCHLAYTSFLLPAVELAHKLAALDILPLGLPRSLWGRHWVC